MKKRRKQIVAIGVCPECKVREGDSSRKKLYKCWYCGRYFCRKHLHPRLAVMRNAIEEIKDPVLKDKVYEEWRKPDGHPDWIWTKQYFSKLEREEEEKRKRFFEVLDTLKKPVERPEKRPIKKPIYVPKPNYVFLPSEQPKNWEHRRNIPIGKIIAVVFLIFVGFLLYANKEFILNVLKQIPLDVVQFPLSFIENPERKDECKEAFEYLNNVRMSYGRSPLKWDDRLYALAVFRAKDMIERNYYDHKTPEGKCAVDFKFQFNITEFGSIPENIGGLTHYEGGAVIGNCKDVVNGWLESRGHRYNLLYPYHISGAIGCYKYYCVFLALSYGNFPCASASEGMSFWNTVPKQPYEV